MHIMVALITLACLLTPSPWQDVEQGLEIPAIEIEEIREIILFEWDGLSDEDLVIEQVKRLHDRAKAYVVVRGQRLIFSLRCVLTDFGPRWGLDGDLSASVRAWPGDEPEGLESAQPPPAAEPAPTEEETAETTTAAGGDESGYLSFITGFVATMSGTGEGGADFASFYYSDTDFNLEAAEGTPEEALDRVQRQRRLFARRCRELASELAGFENVEVEEVVATGIPDAALDELKVLMPGIREFYNTAAVTLIIDGRPGRIVLEGIANIDGQWRLGGLAEHSLPERQEPAQQPQGSS
jgi:hypothetical protein